MKPRNHFTKHQKSTVKFTKKSKTQQSMMADCDINNIMKKFEQTGILPDMIKSNPQYGDFSDVMSYQEAMSLVVHANDQFASLSAKVRDRFNNDPKRFLAFCEDSNNREEMKILGLLKADQITQTTSADTSAEESPAKGQNLKHSGTQDAS